MLARSLFAHAGKAVGELAGVVGQKRLDHYRCDALEASQEVRAAGPGLVAASAKVDPSRGPVDGHEQVPAVRLVSHLRQALDVHVDEAGPWPTRQRFSPERETAGLMNSRTSTSTSRSSSGKRRNLITNNSGPGVSVALSVWGQCDRSCMPSRVRHLRMVATVVL